MSLKKRQVRAAFRDACFKRDRFCCAICGCKADRKDPESTLDAHHISPREEFANGGYVKENGISLCKVGNNCQYSRRGTDISPQLL